MLAAKFLTEPRIAFTPFSGYSGGEYSFKSHNDLWLWQALSMRWSSPIKTIPRGGPSTINGIHYQLLWSLAILGEYHVASCQSSDEQIESLTLVLEPSNGGDQQTISGSERIITQLKARSGEGAWSLQDIIRKVLPDLYLAVDLSQSTTIYQFVTEGHRGKWANVEDFFRTLSPLTSDANPIHVLNDSPDLSFGRSDRNSEAKSTKFWEANTYSQRSLFKKIVDTIRSIKPKSKSETYEISCRKVWLLLRGFRFVGGKSHDSLRRNVDNWLLACIGSDDQLVTRRDALLHDLARRASAGNTTIKASDFFRSHGLDVTPLTNWFGLAKKAGDYLDAKLLRKRVDPYDDVRTAFTDELHAGWTPTAPILVLTGASGTGKTFHGYRLLRSAINDGGVGILVDSRGSYDRDLDEAAKEFWHEFVGVDEAPPLGRVQARLKRMGTQTNQLAFFLDGVSDLDEARRLIETDWEGWGIRLVLTCPNSVADGIRSSIGTRGRIVELTDFTLAELQEYLSENVGIVWDEIPFDIRKTLRRPLLAHLFRDVVPTIGWQPQHEYELYERTWEMLRQRGVHPFAIDALRDLANDVFRHGSEYPWSVTSLRDANIDPSTADKLVSASWLRETSPGRYEIWHDRLLNWAVAEAAAENLRYHSTDNEACCAAVAALFREPRVKCGRLLSYVPMDVLWLLSKPNSPDTGQFSRLIAQCESVLEWRASEILHAELLPTLGDRAVPFLLERLRDPAETDSDSVYAIQKLVDGLVATKCQSIAKHGMDLLADPSPKINRVGVLVLARCPDPSALDRLWWIHADGVRNPTTYLWEHESDWSLHKHTFDALKANAKLDPIWLERAIRDAESSEPVHDLAYLVAQANNIELWQRTKRAIMSKVDDNHERSVATCIQVYRDTSESEWLISRVSSRVDLVGPVALRTLAIFDPQRALASLDSLPEDELYTTRNWCFGELYSRLPEPVMAHFAKRLREHPKPLHFAAVLQGQEDIIDPDSFDFLLDRVSESLEAARHDATLRTPTRRRGLEFANAVCRPCLLDRIRQRRGTPLETHLTDRLVSLGPQMGACLELEKHEGLKTLAKIGGDGFNQVLDNWLEHGDWYARIHAVRLAQRRITSATIKILTRLSEHDSENDASRSGMVSGYAAAALATHGCWQPVMQYYLRVGMKSLTIVDECAAEHILPLGDDILTPVLNQFHSDGSATAGALLFVGLSGRRDLLPRVRTAFCLADPASDIAGASLLTLQWLGDTEPEIVPLIAKCLTHHNLLATNSLLANRSDQAFQALISAFDSKDDLQVAVILANTTTYRETGIQMIARVILSSPRPNFTLVVNRLNPEVLSAVAANPQVFAIAEDVAYGPYGNFCNIGEKPAALRIVGQRQPETAMRTAAQRLRDPDTKDAELYIPLLADFSGDDASQSLLDAVLADPPSRVVYALGRALRFGNRPVKVIEWLNGTCKMRKLAACRVAGFLDPSADLMAALTRCDEILDHDIANSVYAVREQLRKATIVKELEEAFVHECDITHRWVLLDSLISLADPGDSHSSPTWLANVREQLTPAMGKHLNNALKECRKKRNDELNRQDNR